MGHRILNFEFPIWNICCGLLVDWLILKNNSQQMPGLLQFLVTLILVVVVVPNIFFDL